MLSLDILTQCRRNYASFFAVMFEAMWGRTPIFRPFHYEIVNQLHGIVAGTIPNTIINIPPRAGKTTFGAVYFIPWCLLNFPDSEFIYTTYSARLSAKHTYLMRAVMLHPMYQALGGPTLAQDAKSKNEFITSAGGIVYGPGLHGTIVGYGAGKTPSKERDYFGGCIIVDDSINPEHKHSKLILEKTIESYTGSVLTRVNHTDVPIISIGHRAAPNDLIAYQLAGQDGRQWHNLKIPALNDRDESLWPEKWSVPFLTGMRDSPSLSERHKYWCEYQQAPQIRGGNLIKTDQFGYYSVLPKIKSKMMYADTAQKTKEHNDYSVIQCWGEGFDGCIYLLDLIRGKWEAPELTRRAVAFWEKHLAETPRVRQLKIEDKVSGTGLIQELKSNYRIPVKGLQRSKDKYERWNDVSGQVEAGFVKLPKSAPWLSDFLSECEAFTADDTHAHDDQIDPMIDAITDMLGSKNKAKVWERLL